MQAASRKQLASLALLVLVALLALYFTGNRQETHRNAARVGPALTVFVKIHTESDTLMSRPLETVGPLSALSALEQAALLATLPVGIRQYDFGKLVVSIGGHTAGQGGHWTYRVNGELIPLAAEACSLKHGDTLSFGFGRAADDSLAAPSN